MTTDTSALPGNGNPRTEYTYEDYRKERTVPPGDRIPFFEWQIKKEEERIAPGQERIYGSAVAILVALTVIAMASSLLSISPDFSSRYELLQKTSIPGIVGLLWIAVPLFVLLYNWNLRKKVRQLEGSLDRERFESFKSSIYLEAKVNQLRERHNSAVIWLMVMTVGILMYELIEVIAFKNRILEPLNSIPLGLERRYAMELIMMLTLVLWGLTVIVAMTIYFFRYRLPLNDTRRKLADQLNKERNDVANDPEKHREMLLSQVRDMTNTIASVFIDHPERFRYAHRWRKKADDILEDCKKPSKTGTADKMDSHLGDVETLLGQINELILREKNELRQQRQSQVLAIAIILIYIALPILIILLCPQTTMKEVVIPVYGVPLSVIMWAAMGSLCAILTRFNMNQRRVRLDLELRWLIARPIIGVIMGGLAYLAIASGMALLNIGTASTQSTPGGSISPQSLYIYWVIAFLAGFSDSFNEKIIHLITGKALGDTDDPSASRNEAKKAGEVPDTMKKMPKNL